MTEQRPTDPPRADPALGVHPQHMNDRGTHADLLSIARAVRRAAAGDDIRRLHSELTRLRVDLIQHLASEQGETDALPGSTGEIVRGGQRRLLRLVTDVLFDSSDARSDCNCLVRAAEIELALRRQARLETTVRREIPPVGEREGPARSASRSSEAPAVNHPNAVEHRAGGSRA